MEGMWSRFFPAEQALRTLLRSGAIGEPLQADARFTFAGSEVLMYSTLCHHHIQNTCGFATPWKATAVGNEGMLTFTA